MLKKICNFFSTIFLLVLLALAGVMLIPHLLGFKEMAVLSGSMEPGIHVGAVVYVKEVPFEELKVGDIITYQLSADTYVTHRIDTLDSQTQSVTTKGDANNAADANPVSATQIIGKEYMDIPYLGYISIYAKTPPGIAVICGVLAIIIILNFLPDILSNEDEPSEKKEKKSKIKHNMTDM